MPMSQGIVSGGMPGLTLKAWAIFSAGTLISGQNVSSITRAAAGDYTVTFSSALSDANYVVTVNLGTGEGDWVRTNTAKTAANFRLLTYSAGGFSSLNEYTPVHVAIWA